MTLLELIDQAESAVSRCGATPEEQVAIRRLFEAACVAGSFQEPDEDAFDDFDDC